jgi:hypothetical protein
LNSKLRWNMVVGADEGQTLVTMISA